MKAINYNIYTILSKKVITTELIVKIVDKIAIFTTSYNGNYVRSVT